MIIAFSLDKFYIYIYIYIYKFYIGSVSMYPSINHIISINFILFLVDRKKRN
ncbi:hypothetical protein Lalb_Chr20g0109511 [Lupinus albus]|uniref:Uncharacterized protein n=1 Tax=Lupinus albus TaxID=3870 RepID=A0A6A4NNX5_LUPAL|nr:hypothetical protein Lalb_Chr20g0109511 [Lupinus albus]